MKRRIIMMVVCAVLLLSNKCFAGTDIEALFRDPPAEARLGVFWFWMNGNVTKEGITADLEAMNKAGIGSALIMWCALKPNEDGPVRFDSPEFWDIILHTGREAQRLGVDLIFENCPGWSFSGGPWIKPEQSCRQIVCVETRAKGPGPATLKLARPKPAVGHYSRKEIAMFEDLQVIAFPTPNAWKRLSVCQPFFSSSAVGKDVSFLVKEKAGSVLDLELRSEEDRPWVQIEVASPFSARRLTLRGTHDMTDKSRYPLCELHVSNDGKQFRCVNQFPVPHHAFSVDLPGESARWMRLVFQSRSDMAVAMKIGAVEMDTQLRLYQNSWPERRLDYEVPAQADMIVDPNRIVDLTGKLAADDSLAWDVPAGDWTVLRICSQPTGAECKPTTPEALGLECDKLDSDAVEAQWKGFSARVIDLFKKEKLTSLKGIEHDSFENGPMNWSPRFRAEFRRLRGYDPLPWLPALHGVVVSSFDESNRFLWDLRRTYADIFPVTHEKTFQRRAGESGVIFWAENHYAAYDWMDAYRYVDVPMCEFWTGANFGTIRAATSASHFWGRRYVGAEAHTSVASGDSWRLSLEGLRYNGDRAFAEGVNRFMIHRWVQQPYLDRVPGMTHGYNGCQFERTQTWWNEVGGYVSYINRCQALLQAGAPVADVLAYLGEAVPTVSNGRRPAGYDFDYVNSSMLAGELKVDDGQLVVPSGVRYRLLVLAEDDRSCRPEILKALAKLIRSGAVVLGAKPLLSPSLEKYPECDVEVKKMADQIWGSEEGKGDRKYGKGRVLWGMTQEEALIKLDVLPDVVPPKGIAPYLSWTHRRVDGSEIYFFHNAGGPAFDGLVTFRVKGLRPELWDAVTGDIEALPEWRATEDGRTEVRVKALARKSFIIVFRGSAPALPTHNYADLKLVQEIPGPWEVAFDAKWMGPKVGTTGSVVLGRPGGSSLPDGKQIVTFDKLISWTERTEEGIRYYSGTAVYRKIFDFPAGDRGPLYLDLGEVQILACVKLNGKDLGRTWCAPWRVEVPAGLLMEHGNELEIKVINQWANRLRLDGILPEEKRVTWTPGNPYAEQIDSATGLPRKKDTWQIELNRAGLLGPVQVVGE